MISNREARAAKRAAAAEKRKQEVERKRREREEELKKQKEEQERQEKLKAELEDQRRKKEEERRWVILTCGCYNELFHEFKVCFNPRKITYVLLKPSMADSSQFSPLTTLSEQLGPNSWVSSVFIPAFIANIGKLFFLKHDYQNSKSI